MTIKKIGIAVALTGAFVLCADVALNAMGINGFFDFFQIAAPGNPPTGQARVYVDSGTLKLACLLPSGASCAPTGGGGGGTTQPQQIQSIAVRGNPLASAAMTNNVTSGDVMVVAIGWYAGANAPSSLADSLNTSYTKVVELTGGGTNAALYVGTLTSSGALTITPTYPLSASYEGIAASEFLGSSVTTTVDVFGSARAAPLTLTTTTDGDLIWTYAENESNGKSLFAPPGFFQGIQATNADSCSFAFQVQPKAGKIFTSMWGPGYAGLYADTDVSVALKHP